MTSTRTRGLALAAVTATISGVAIYVNANGVAAYGDATAYTTAKNAASALVIALAFVLARRAKGAGAVALTRPSQPGHWWGLIVVAVLGGAVPFVLFFEGLASTASTQAAFLHKTQLVWVAVLAVLLLKEKLTWWHGAAIVLLIVAQFGLAGDVRIIADVGTALIAAATLMWAVEVAITKRLLRDMSAWTLSLTRMAGGSVALLAWSAMTGSLGTVVPSTATQWGWVAVTGVLLAGYVLSWHEALARAQAVDVTAVLSLGALVTAALAGAFDAVPLAAQAPWLAMIAAGGLLVWLAPQLSARGRRAVT
ncbi:DMT family transporter [Demequina aestuarii]|uniref:DMT family transporter n=1 Tax=Demequina aestuarii TaxID=327095 RepID=UPI000782BDC3|nr:DMT family transporter [Demequina aestuarii]